LKEKRSRIKPILARLHREFNVSAAEIDRQDAWQEAVIACAVVSNDRDHIQRVLAEVHKYVERSWPDEQVWDHQTELL
jgi:uncharacterized protein YlxP (DUF503 family)